MSSHSTEKHEDGSYTERYGDDRSITYESDGSVREDSRTESYLPFGITVPGMPDFRTTYNGEGNVTNVQWKERK